MVGLRVFMGPSECYGSRSKWSKFKFFTLIIKQMYTAKIKRPIVLKCELCVCSNEYFSLNWRFFFDHLELEPYLIRQTWHYCISEGKWKYSIMIFPLSRGEGGEILATNLAGGHWLQKHPTSANLITQHNMVENLQ